MRSILLALPLCLILLVSEATADEPSSSLVLFVGNSLTYYNDVPELLQQISRNNRNAEEVQVEMLAAAGASIAQHLEGGHLQRHLARGNYTYVVFQDIGGWPICPPEFPGCSESIASIENISKLARSAGAEPIWYSTYQRIPAAQAALSEEARQIAARLDIQLADVGAAWAFYESLAGIDSPFLEDGHPNYIGSFIAATTIFQAISGGNDLADLRVRELCFRQWQGTGLSKANLASDQEAPNLECKSITPQQQQHVIDAANKGFNTDADKAGAG